MKVRELDQYDMKIEEGISVEEASTRLINGEDFGCITINAILYHYGFYNEEAVCINKGCSDCIFNDGAGVVGCIATSSKYVRELIADKLVHRESIEMMI